MSLEKAIQKLTQVIKAKTGVSPGVGPGGREIISDPCRGVIPGDGAYCDCYKKSNPDYEGPCYFQGNNGKCYIKIYIKKSKKPYNETRNGNCPGIGIPTASSL